MRDIPAIRSVLDIDRASAAYAIGDLAPGFFEHCSWFQPPGDGGALALLYRAFTPPVLYTQGNLETLAAILDEFCTDRAVYLHVRPDILPILGARYRIVELRHMWRIILERKDCQGAARAMWSACPRRSNRRWSNFIPTVTPRGRGRISSIPPCRTKASSTGCGRVGNWLP